MMSAHLVSTAEPTLHLCSKSKNSVTANVISSISFSSQVTKSRISVKNRTRPGRARIQAFYAPVETRETLYQVLGITETGSSYSEIKKAYKEMARKYHPDVSPPERVDEYTRRLFWCTRLTKRCLIRRNELPTIEIWLRDPGSGVQLAENLDSIIREWRRKGSGNIGGKFKWMN
ncbi:UNVERIFIED_CONTAM: Chaperone protein dnaJ 20, chloroplastic [Sesamum calycinum]|uniref:Chaperone protein dnaJ 20, chloroplastic n=1 Tax=Sesamum calycinum TaxID=2727403 RepID=A0AAW2SBT5_9LAMI